MIDQKKAIGKRLRELRIHRGLSQSDLATRLARSKQLVSGWENGRFEMTATIAMSTALALGTSADWLLGGIGREGRNPLVLEGWTIVPLLSANELVDYVRGNLGAATNYGCCPGVLPPNSFAFIAPDCSMRPALRKDDMLFVAPTDTYRPGSIVVALAFGKTAQTEATAIVGRIEFPVLRQNVPYKLTPDARGWPSIDVDVASDVVLCGRVTRAWTRVDP